MARYPVEYGGKNEMTETRCRVVLGKRTSKPYSVANLVQEKVKEGAPLLAWAEPHPLRTDLSGSTGRRSDFDPFVCGRPSWPVDFPLVEARLFWDKTAVHVVAEEEGGCTWVCLREVDAGSDGLEVLRCEFPVLSLRDSKRFGLQTLQEIEGLYAIEYWQHGRLVAWRLVIEQRSVIEGKSLLSKLARKGPNWTS
jgi:hypothetical protein